MNYIAFDFDINSIEQAEQLVAILSEHQFNGFEETENLLKAFIAEELYSETDLSTTLSVFTDLKYSVSVIENINWNQQWEQSFEPVVVNDFVAIRAHFHQPITSVQYEIIITPKMSFGTGHHATTHMMVQQMQGINFKNKKVFDFGTGTGILAILAEKLGAEQIYAIDIDEWSITNAKENMVQNNCSKIIIELEDSIPTAKKYDIILANINLNVISASLSAIKKVSNAPCIILLSGFLKENESELSGKIQEFGFTQLATIQKGQWICMHLSL